MGCFSRAGKCVGSEFVGTLDDQELGIRHREAVRPAKASARDGEGLPDAAISPYEKETATSGYAFLAVTLFV